MEVVEPGLSSLIITLAEDASARRGALAALARRADLTLGERGGAWLPAVLSTDDARAAFSEIEAIAGVELVEVVFVEIPEPATA